MTEQQLPEPIDNFKAIEKKINVQMFGKLLVIAVMMFGFGYSLVPLYKRICQLTGVNVLSTQEASGAVAEPRNTQVDLTRTIIVEFDANSRGPWRFRPTVNSLKVHPGELSNVVYEVVNKQPRLIHAQAIPSYAPMEAGGFFKKVECFCFKQQTLGPNEARQMPVAFYVDPAIPKNVTTITLSYTFFEVGLPVATATQ